MLDPKENLRTLERFDRIAAKSEFADPGDHLRVISKRLVYLYEKRATLHAKGHPAFQLDREIDALFWLMAFHYVWAGREVKPCLKRVKGHELIDFKRFERMIDHVIAAKASEDSSPFNKAA